MEPSIPEIAGTTTITFNGTSGIRLRAPQEVSLSAEDFAFKLAGDAAFGHLSPLDSPCRAGFPPQDGSRPDWCFDYQFRLIDGWMMSPNTLAPGIKTLPAGPFDLYMVTEGRVTLSFSVPELDGDVSYQATGLLDGDIVNHSVTCPTETVPGCDRQGWGGQRFDSVPAEATVGAMTFAQRPNNLSPTNDPSPGTVGVGSCIYPSSFNPEKSSNPKDHPRGCDPDESGFLTFQNVYVTSTASPLAVSYAHFRAEHVKTPGPYYTGFAAHAVESAEAIEGPGRYGSFGYWYSRQIRCPSGAWTACQ